MTTLDPFAPLACDPAKSRGRVRAEPESLGRSAFERDRDRIIHSGAFRRLKHKTQVFVYHEGDYYRTRLTHSIEVAQIARSVARKLRLNEDLAEALALAHDLGHTPFGHAGEEVLDALMRPFGGFDHNVQTLRILTRLEQRYAEFDGLNLTWEAIEGIAKHNGPVAGPLATRPMPPGLPDAVAAYEALHPLGLDSFAPAEAQVASLSDDIAYNNHDIDDGLRAGLFGLADLEPVPLVGPLVDEVRKRYPGIDRQRLIHEVVRRMINRMVVDLVEETRRRIDAARPGSPDAVRALGRPLVAFSPQMADNDRALKAFLKRHMYRHYRVNRMMSKAKRIVRELFELFMEEPDTLPDEWHARTDGRATPRTARVVSDYIAGMTDRYALDEHHRLFDRYSKT